MTGCLIILHLTEQTQEIAKQWKGRVIWIKAKNTIDEVVHLKTEEERVFNVEIKEVKKTKAKKKKEELPKQPEEEVKERETVDEDVEQVLDEVINEELSEPSSGGVFSDQEDCEKDVCSSKCSSQSPKKT